MIVLWTILVLLAAWIALIVIRACLFKPYPQPKMDNVPFEVDAEKATDHFAQLIRCKTVSDRDESKVDLSQFTKLQGLLPEFYPTVFSTCEHEIVEKHGLLFRWKGRSSEKSAVLMAHYDVVPVTEDQWEVDPFGGIIKDGELWGRGTLDTKGTFMGILEAAEILMKQGFTPKNDVYFCFGGDEEIMGDDAPAIVDELEKRGIRPEFVLDEGGAIVENVFPGVKQPSALIGIAEKGSMFMDIAAKGKGGHASAPPSKQGVGILAKALNKLHTKAMPFALTDSAKQMFDIMGRNSTFVFKLIFANLWCFAPLLNLICKASGGELNALVRTTCALTKLQAADAYNVLPNEAKAGVNVRVISGETVQGVKERMEKIIDDNNVTLTVVDGNDPSPISPASGEQWDIISNAILQTYPGVLVSPYLMLACSDSRHYCRICNNVYRFSAMPMSKEQRGMIHNNNERIRLDMIEDTIAFFGRVLKQC